MSKSEYLKNRFPFKHRVQVLHCLHQAAKGGETILVDGFKVAEIFKAECPEGFEFLSKTPVSAEYIHTNTEPHQHFLSEDVIFKHDRNSNLIGFRYNMNDRAPHKFSLEQQRSFYKFYPRLSKVVNDPSNAFKILLQPGTVLLIDNWRVMHGRLGFEGKRIMSGCYITRDDLLSKARVLGLM